MLEAAIDQGKQGTLWSGAFSGRYTYARATGETQGILSGWVDATGLVQLKLIPGSFGQSEMDVGGIMGSNGVFAVHVGSQSPVQGYPTVRAEPTRQGLRVHITSYGYPYAADTLDLDLQRKPAKRVTTGRAP